VLHDPELHERLTDRAWDAAWAGDAVAAIVADTDAAYDDLWPAHEWDGYRAVTPLKNMYVGAAGVVWALAELGTSGFASSLDLAAVARQTLERFCAEPDYMEGEESPYRRSALLVGETGIALVAWRLAPDDAVADTLLDLVRANVPNDANDVMWGVPGTLLAARAMHAWTREERWRAAVRASEDALRAARKPDGLWTQHLWGTSWDGLSAIHGMTGNALALGERGNAADVLRAKATVEDGHANWFGDSWRLQWCTGAPGIVTHSAAYLDEDILLAAAQLIWDAGPSRTDEKGAGICHGTAGNGYALLKTFQRTEDELWLERARAFAVHALEQTQRLPPRHSLFTGGVGAALFAVDCLDGTPRYPILDRL
jgi:lanthionine synthetase-like protein